MGRIHHLVKILKKNDLELSQKVKTNCILSTKEIHIMKTSITFKKWAKNILKIFLKVQGG